MKISFTCFFLICNVATRKCKVIEMVHIIFLLDGTNVVWNRNIVIAVYSKGKKYV